MCLAAQKEDVLRRSAVSDKYCGCKWQIHDTQSESRSGRLIVRQTLDFERLANVWGPVTIYPFPEVSELWKDRGIDRKGEKGSKISPTPTMHAWFLGNALSRYHR